VLLQKNWFELFALGMSQCARALSLTTLLTNISLQFQTNISNGKLTFTKSSVINEQLFYLQNFITECERLNINELEYAYLKVICIFDCGKLFIFSKKKNKI
jgi:nuclear receptor subfamily 2 group C